jgi:kynurenine formamidase
VSAGTPVFPGDGPVRVTVLDQPSVNLSRIDLCVHTGTHMDAPFHFFNGGETIDRVALDRCVGPARIIDLRDIAPGSAIRREHLERRCAAPLRGHAAILFTGWSKQWGAPCYFSEHPCLAADAAQFLADCGVQLVGVDMPSVDRAPYPAHQILLRAGVPIVENLTNVEAIGADLFQIVVLPLKLAGRDGSPVRAVAIVAEPRA